MARVENTQTRNRIEAWVMHVTTLSELVDTMTAIGEATMASNIFRLSVGGSAMGYEDGGYAGTLDLTERNDASGPGDAPSNAFPTSEAATDIDVSGAPSDAFGTSEAGTDADVSGLDDAPSDPLDTGDDGQNSQNSWYGDFLDSVYDVWSQVKEYFTRSNRPSYTAEELSDIAREAYNLHPEHCNQSTEHVANAYENHDLDNKNANQQVAQMQENWNQINPKAAQILANSGELVVAGLADPGGYGHTAVVTPGDGRTAFDGRFYPNVTGGGSPEDRSDGSRTAGDVWSQSNRRNVTYYTPR